MSKKKNAEVPQKRNIIFLPPEVTEKLRIIAKEKGLSVSAVMRMIIMEYLAKK